MANTDHLETATAVFGVCSLRFIMNYNGIAIPLTKLISPSLPFVWSPEAAKAFAEFKKLVISAPILVQPDPSQQLIVEVGASHTGVGAILFQHSGPNQKLYLCVFFSRCLFPAE